jgi:hypothetical protein
LTGLDEGERLAHRRCTQKHSVASRAPFPPLLARGDGRTRRSRRAQHHVRGGVLAALFLGPNGEGPRRASAFRASERKSWHSGYSETGGPLLGAAS